MIDDPVDAVLERAAAAGVEWLLCPGIDTATSVTALELAAANPGRVLAAAGLHPNDAIVWNEQCDSIAALASDAAAVGEIGLDYYRDQAPREIQKRAFREQLALAADLELPVVVHCRDAFADLYDEIEAAGAGPRTVLHSWTGGPRWTKRFAGLGVTFSFAGMITYPGGDTVRRAAALAPPERTMVETDSPFLTPEPDRHLSNEPANLPRTGTALADVWGVPVAEVARFTRERAATVFRRV
jgi:TatD DNase family protein